MGTPINSYAAGGRRYMGTRSAPNVGAVANKTGYNARELRRQAQERAFQQRLQAGIKRRAI